MFKSLHHIAIICSHYQNSKDFYVNKLGFKILNETYREERKSYKLDLALDGIYLIELFSFPNPPKRTNNPEASGLRHVCFAVNDIDEAIKELKLKGIECEEKRTDQLTGKEYTFFKDPDGLPIEIYKM